MLPIRWGDPNPGHLSGQRVPPIFNAQPNPRKLVFLDDPVWVWTHHWGRTVPCVEPRDKCPLCVERGLEAKLISYSAADLCGGENHWQLVACCVPEVASEVIREQVPLRGLGVKIWRTPRGNGFDVHVEPLGRVTRELPPAFDMRERLAQLWRGLPYAVQAAAPTQPIPAVPPPAPLSTPPVPRDPLAPPARPRKGGRERRLRRPKGGA